MRRMRRGVEKRDWKRATLLHNWQKVKSLKMSMITLTKSLP